MTRIIAIAFALLASSAYARDRLDPALQGDDVKVCTGILTTNGTCIGSESNVAPPSYEGTIIYRRHRDRDSDQQDDDRTESDRP
jgi:hypothetical protein